MKKLMALLVLGSLALGLPGCSGTSESTKTNTDGTPKEPPASPKPGTEP